MQSRCINEQCSEEPHNVKTVMMNQDVRKTSHCVSPLTRHSVCGVACTLYMTLCTVLLPGTVLPINKHNIGKNLLKNPNF